MRSLSNVYVNSYYNYKPSVLLFAFNFKLTNDLTAGVLHIRNIIKNTTLYFPVLVGILKLKSTSLFLRKNISILLYVFVMKTKKVLKILVLVKLCIWDQSK